MIPVELVEGLGTASVVTDLLSLVLPDEEVAETEAPVWV